jgi:hypothetical protein
MIIFLLLSCADKENSLEESEIIEIVDTDGDGFDRTEDCNDGDATIFPAAMELCDGTDNDCDGYIDEEVEETFYVDADADGFGSPDIYIQACSAPQGFISNGSDCDDTDATSHPGAAEICDLVDNDCNSLIDDGLGIDVYIDGDGDGYGSSLERIESCFVPEGYSSNDGDCDDSNERANPSELEFCDGMDNNCNGIIDEDIAEDAPIWYEDVDNDGFGNTQFFVHACTQPSGFVVNDLDCDDVNSDTFPGADEFCNFVDDDCDGYIDEEGIDGLNWYEDGDEDGYGDSASVVRSCTQPAGYLENGEDCDDNDNDISPVGIEECNGEDDDCDGVVDLDAIDIISWYEDVDEDGYGDSNTLIMSCDEPAGYVFVAGDCNDAEPLISPVAIEICNTIDDDCDGTIDTDASDILTWYVDVDGDGFGDATVSEESCEQPFSYVLDGTDCLDSDEDVYLGAAEVWYDGIDQDCLGGSDFDQDADGFDSFLYGGDDCEDTDETLYSDCDFGLGLDDLIVSGDVIVNQYDTLFLDAVPGDSSIVVDTPSLYTLGTEIMIIQQQGGSAGVYEFQYVMSVDGTMLNLKETLSNEYIASNAQVIVVPNYQNVSIPVSQRIVAQDWDGETGGVIALRVAESMTVEGSIDVSEQGYRGGIQVNNTSHWNGYTGESIYPSTQLASNSALEGGGGSSYCSCGEAAGAGGHGTSGGSVSGNSCSGQAHGQAGASYGTTDLSSVFFGSGGGGGCRDDASCEYPPGRDGGGIVFIAAKELSISGGIYASGEDADGGQHGTCDDTIGGAGAGGSILLISDTLTLGSSVLDASGGDSTYISQSSVTTGVGGDGRVRVDFGTLNGAENGTFSADTDLSLASVPAVGHSVAR